ncbi:MAG: hypothetical protein WC150_05985 [Bacteroidia bacterium]
MEIKSSTLRLLVFTTISLIYIGCDRGKKQSIEIVQKSQVQFVQQDISDNPLFKLFQQELQNELGAGSGLDPNSTWLDFANKIAKEDPNTKYEWNSASTSDADVYLVAFTDNIGWGHRWEANIKTNIVKYVNQDEYLSYKYGLTRLDDDTLFEVVDLTKNEISNQYKKGNRGKKEIVYLIKGKIKNKTGKTLTSGKLKGNLKIIYKDKSVIGSSKCKFWETKCGFKRNITTNSPWKCNDAIEFSIKTEGIDDLYLDYEPEYALFNLELQTGDPIGFSYDKAIVEYDVKKQWTSFKK